ncbi:MAG: glycosyltransferase, partial [Mucilaginibacter sp.]
HRYIPVIAKWAGFTKIGEQVVEHRPRKYGKTKFGLNRFINGLLDLMSIFFVGKFGKRPMHFFGALGTLSFLAGTVITIWIIAEKLSNLAHGIKPRQPTDNPLFYIALVAVILGSQLFLTGFVAELVARSAHERNKYQVEEVI